jgi:hypothetical protein
MANYAIFNPLEKCKKNNINENNITMQNIRDVPFLFIQDHKKNFKDIANTALKGIQEGTTLSDIFFSKSNINRLQKKIRQTILIKTNGNYKLDVDQDESELLIAMRAVYYDEAKFLPDKIIHQIKLLNIKVMDYIIPDILTAIKQEYAYLKEINEPLKPIKRPINVNVEKQILPSLTTLFN